MKTYKESALVNKISPETFRYIRKALELTQKEMASFLNISLASVKRFETGKKDVSGSVSYLMQTYFLNRNAIKANVARGSNFNVRFLYKNHNIVTAIIDVDSLNKIVKVENFASDSYLLPFGNHIPTYKDYLDLLRDRCFPEEGQNAPFELKKLGLPFYDPFLIVCKTQGRVYGDGFSMELVD